ncbi:hypothetical protein TNCV_2897951 [Trichonephila clavipes]|nr:hypothetical protein TNCV_2897951 [Trichonephila clavipes]
MILCVAELLEKIEEGRKITDAAREFDTLTALFHGCGSHLKLLECSRRHGEIVLEVRRLQRQRYIVLSAKKQAHHSSAGTQISFLLPQESRSPEKLLPDV